MKKRYLYALLFGIPGFFLAGLLSIFLFAALAGILWLYVFGDNAWPAAVDTIVPVLFAGAVLAIWVAIIAAGYGIGRRLENDPRLNRKHILLSAGLTLTFILFMVFQQWGQGKIGPGSASVLCSDFCARHGYAGSGIPPQTSGQRTCSCYDPAGNEAIVVPLESLSPDRP